MEQNLLFHYLPEFKAFEARAHDHGDSDDDDSTDVKDAGTDESEIEDRNEDKDEEVRRKDERIPHYEGLDALNLLIHHLDKQYASANERLRPLLALKQITWDLLWALFKPNDHVISKCPGTGKQKCLRYGMGEKKKTEQGVEYFELECRYLDFDGDLFGTVVDKLKIQKFRGARPINSLEVVPLWCHSEVEQLRTSLKAHGQKFRALQGRHHRSYTGQAFFQRKEGLLRWPVQSRIMVDAAQFRKINPNYPKLFTSRVETFVDLLSGASHGEEQNVARITDHGVNMGDFQDDDLLTCSPTVMAFSLADKLWGLWIVFRP